MNRITSSSSTKALAVAIGVYLAYKTVYKPTVGGSVNAPASPSRGRGQDLQGLRQSLIGRLDRDVVPAMLYHDCATSRVTVDLLLGVNTATDMGWKPVSTFRVEVRPGYEVVAMDGKSDQIWIGPVEECVNHTNFTPTAFIVRRSTSATDLDRSKLPSHRVSQAALDAGRQTGDVSEATENVLDFVKSENTDLKRVFMHSDSRW